jgi:hypothetical protein
MIMMGNIEKAKNKQATRVGHRMNSDRSHQEEG